jgi:O-antigen/teichoic acid export membrane protein
MAAAAAIVATSGGGLEAVAVATALAAVAATLIAAARCWATDRVRLAAPSRRDVSQVVRYAGTVSAVTGTGVLHRTMDRTIAGVALGPSAVTLVEIANQLQAGATALLSASTYPVLSSAPWLQARDDRPALAALLQRATRYSVLLTLPLCGLGLVLADPFIRAWVGARFIAAVGLTQVALLFVVIAAPLQAGGNLLQGMGQARQVLRASVASVLVNLVVSVVLVQTIGLVGVVIGTVVGELAIFPLLARSVGRALDQPPLAAIRPAVVRAVPAALAAAAGAGAAVLLPLSPTPTVILGGVLGTAASLAVAIGWSLPAAERTELRAALRRGTA